MSRRQVQTRPHFRPKPTTPKLRPTTTTRRKSVRRRFNVSTPSRAPATSAPPPATTPLQLRAAVMAPSPGKSPKPFSPTSSCPCSTGSRSGPAVTERPDAGLRTSRSIALYRKSRSEFRRGIAGPRLRPEQRLPSPRKSSRRNHRADIIIITTGLRRIKTE